MSPGGLMRLQEGPMRDPRLSDLIRSLPLRPGIVISAGALAFVLAAGLACHENAPTEIRTPPTAPVEGGAGEDPDLAAGDLTAMAITLPVNQSIATTAPAPAFRINQTGTGPNGIFQINRSTGTRPALQALTNARAQAGLFQNTNAANPLPALEARSNGTGWALRTRSTGSGGGMLVEQANENNNQPALLVQSNGGGHGIHVQHNSGGPGQGLMVESNGEGALRVIGNGTLVGASFEAGGGFVPRTLQALNNLGGLAGYFEAHSGIGLRTVMGNPDFNSPSWYALEAEGLNGASAANFSGRVDVHGPMNVNGTLTKTAGSFRIDHPLDPEHKYLSHSFVESPDMMNVYNGNATLDEQGRATVELPVYFEALNRDFRYQLTAIGAPGPNLYIAQGVAQNRFRIAGGRPYASVSWQVTGVRQDAYANEHRIKVEEAKPDQPEKPGRDRLVARR
jgi:hypothetical protein